VSYAYGAGAIKPAERQYGFVLNGIDRYDLTGVQPTAGDITAMNLIEFGANPNGHNRAGPAMQRRREAASHNLEPTNGAMMKLNGIDPGDFAVQLPVNDDGLNIHR